MSREESKALIRYGELRGNLPDEVKAKLQEYEEADRPYSELVTMAEVAMLTANRPAGPSNGTQRRGYGATPPHSPPTTPRPASMSELQALMEKDPKAYDRVMADPSFDTSTLPRS